MLKIARMIFLVLGESPTFGINGNVGSAKKTFCINFSKANTNFCLSLHYNADDIQQTFVGLQDFLKTSSRHVLNTFSRHVLNTSSTHLQDVLKPCLEDV